MESHERQLAALDALIEEGVADAEAGRVIDADLVFDELEARYAKMAAAPVLPNRHSLAPTACG